MRFGALVRLLTIMTLTVFLALLTLTVVVYCEFVQEEIIIKEIKESRIAPDTIVARAEDMRERSQDVDRHWQDISRSWERSRLVTMEATGYCPCAYCNGNSLAIARNGQPLKPGVTVAVCADDVPLGTRLYVEGHGWKIAEDTGSAIGHGRLDILFATHAEALAWGRKKVEVRIFYD